MKRVAVGSNAINRNEKFNGLVAELMYFNSALTEEEMQQVEVDLFHKWLADDPPTQGCTGVDCGTGGTCEDVRMCAWVANNLNTVDEQRFADVSTPAECIAQCRNALGGYTIANVDTAVLAGGSGECWCQYGDNMAEDPAETAYNSCLLSTAATSYTCVCEPGYEGSSNNDGPATCVSGPSADPPW